MISNHALAGAMQDGIHDNEALAKARKYLHCQAEEIEPKGSSHTLDIDACS